MLTSTSLPFFTSIFLAFHGSLAEVLLVMCRHVTIELYNILFYIDICNAIAYEDRTLGLIQL